MSYKNQFSVGIVGSLLWLGILCAILYGYVANIIAIAGSNFDTITPLLVLRFIGVIFFPLGWILGLFF
jgi:O-antigen ligase